MSRKTLIALMAGLASAESNTQWLTCTSQCSDNELQLVSKLNAKYSERLSKKRVEHEVLFHSESVVNQIVETIQIMHPDVNVEDAKKYAMWFVQKGPRQDDMQLLANSKGFEISFETLDEVKQLNLMKQLDCSYSNCIAAFDDLKKDILASIADA